MTFNYDKEVEILEKCFKSDCEQLAECCAEKEYLKKKDLLERQLFIEKMKLKKKRQQLQKEYQQSQQVKQKSVNKEARMNIFEYEKKKNITNSFDNETETINSSLSSISNARGVLNRRAKTNRRKILSEKIQYYKTIVKTQAEKNACDAILNSNYSTEDKEYLFNDGLFRTEEELQEFECAKKREEFVNSGKWADYCEIRDFIVWTFIGAIIVDILAGIISFFSFNFDVTLFCVIAIFPLGFGALIANLVTSSQIVNKGKELGINDEYTKKAKVEQVGSVTGLVAGGASVARNTKKFVKRNGFI